MVCFALLCFALLATYIKYYCYCARNNNRQNLVMYANQVQGYRYSVCTDVVNTIRSVHTYLMWVWARALAINLFDIPRNHNTTAAASRLSAREIDISRTKMGKEKLTGRWSQWNGYFIPMQINLNDTIPQQTETFHVQLEWIIQSWITRRAVCVEI